MANPAGENGRNREDEPWLATTPLFQHFRSPSTFVGDSGQDPNKWLKDYDRVSKYNRWDDCMRLANVYFFLHGTAKQWFENNEETLDSWSKFETEIKSTFGDAKRHVLNAEEQLKNRAQRQGESTQSYIQNVLGLCQKINPSMKEGEKVSHLMKGVAEDVYQTLLTKNISTTSEFISTCQYIEEMQQKRIGRNKFSRLPNVVPVASLEEQADLVGLVRQVVREEVQRILSESTLTSASNSPSLEEMIREEVVNTLAPISSSNSPWREVKPRRQSTYTAPSRSQQLPIGQSRKTDLWRTEDNKPVCFHCGRPGHVARYCRERKQVFDTYRRNRGMQNTNREYSRNGNRNLSPYAESNEEAWRGQRRYRSQSPNSEEGRGRSPVRRRYRSPSPFQRSSRSPSRQEEEN